MKKKVLTKNDLLTAIEILSQPRIPAPPSQKEINRAAKNGQCAYCNQFELPGSSREIYRDNDMIGYICTQCGSTFIAGSD